MPSKKSTFRGLMTSKSNRLNGLLNLKNCVIQLVLICYLPVFAQPLIPSVSNCGNVFVNHYGPWDFRTDSDKLPIVLGRHFTPEVEALIRGNTDTLPGPDIDYTLKAIPNHHRALISIMRLGEKENTPQARRTSYSVECYFIRATRFRPDDSIVRMIYSTYLNSKGRLLDAKDQLKTASHYAKDNAFTHYNIGLHYFDLKDYENALFEAHQAMALGFTQSALREKLLSIGRWIEPVVNGETSAPANARPETSN